VGDCDPLVNGIDLTLDGLDPEYEFLIFAMQLGAFPFQFPFNTHVVQIQKWSRKLPNRLNQIS
jgi:hypothetical protein